MHPKLQQLSNHCPQCGQDGPNARWDELPYMHGVLLLICCYCGYKKGYEANGPYQSKGYIEGQEAEDAWQKARVTHAICTRYGWGWKPEDVLTYWVDDKGSK